MPIHLNLFINAFMPWMSVRADNDCEGILCHLLKYVSKSMNFSYTLFGQNESLGTKLANGSWTGGISHLQTNVIIP